MRKIDRIIIKQIQKIETGVPETRDNRFETNVFDYLFFFQFIDDYNIECINTRNKLSIPPHLIADISQRHVVADRSRYRCLNRRRKYSKVHIRVI